MLMCVWTKFDTGLGYSNFKSGYHIQSISLPIGWTFCPFCGEKIDRKMIK
jgi:hypothetical protein